VLLHFWLVKINCGCYSYSVKERKRCNNYIFDYINVVNLKNVLVFLFSYNLCLGVIKL